MTNRIVTIIILSLTICLATYSVRLIHHAVSYYEKDVWLIYPTFILAFTLPVLIIFTFFKRFTKLIAIITALVILLCFSFGFHFVGFAQMFQTYLLLTILYLISIISLSVIIYKTKKHITADT